MIQSLSIVVPNAKCINKCEFCVARMVDASNSPYKDQMNENLPFIDLYLQDYLKRLEYARDNGVNTVMLTGDSEPQQNRHFLTMFGLFMMLMERPFRCIEMQTTGVLLDENYLRFLRNHVGVNLISLSMSSFNDLDNRRINGTPEALRVSLSDLCQKIKKYDFNLRLSLNLNDSFNDYRAEDIFETAHRWGADQLTFRVLYSDGHDTEQERWIKAHPYDPQRLIEINNFIKRGGRALELLPFGYTKYSVDGLSVVLDDDSMSSSVKEDLKYFILRTDCKLYSKWDDKASLIF